jgi:hypothetical protein
MLTIPRTKFCKSRQIPMHPSTVDALRRYRRSRDLAEGPPAEDGPFFVGTRGRRRGLALGERQVHRVFRDLHSSWAAATAERTDRVLAVITGQLNELVGYLAFLIPVRTAIPLTDSCSQFLSRCHAEPPRHKSLPPAF